MSINCYNKNIGRLTLKSLNLESEEDYDIWKNITTDYNIMKSASLFNGQIAQNEFSIKKTFQLISEHNPNENLFSHKILDEGGNILGVHCFLVSERDSYNNPKIIETGFLLKPKYFGKKIMSNVSTKMVENLKKDHPNIQTIFATCFSSNLGSQGVLKKIGMEKIHEYKGYNNNVYVYSLNFPNEKRSENKNVSDISLRKIIN
ncbi:GNAT family N-acetyltransferase [Pseudomonadota bacterium]